MQTEQPELVLQFGREALNQREGQAFKRDILLSMALAHCTMASYAFEGNDQVCCNSFIAFCRDLLQLQRESCCRPT